MFITVVLLATWAAMLTLYHPSRGADWLYRTTARPALLGGLFAGTLNLTGIRPPMAEAGFAESLIACWLVGGFFYLVTRYFQIWPNDSKGDDSHRRGSTILSTKDLVKLTNREAGHARLGEIRIPARVEDRHFLLAGSTGAGKTQAFLQLTESAKERGHAALVADVGAAFASRYYNPKTDTILNPHDARGADWSPLAEMRGEWDAEGIAKSMIPDKDGGDNEWQLYSQTLLAAVLQRLFEAGNGTNSEIVRLLTIASNKELAEVVSGLPAQALFDAGASRMLGSIRGIVSTYIKPLAWCNPEAGEGAFSIRQHIQEERKGWVFITVRNDQLDALKPLIAAQVDIAISALLSMSVSDTRRQWFFLDEFATFGRIQGIESLLTKARKNGGVGVLGMQSISQLNDTYGHQKAQTLLSCLGTWLTLRVQDAETAEYMSKYIGDQEVLRLNTSTGNSSQGTTTTQSQQVAVQRAVMPSQLQSLQDRVGILNIVGATPAGWITVPVSTSKPAVEEFIDRPRRASPSTA